VKFWHAFVGTNAKNKKLPKFYYLVCAGFLFFGFISSASAATYYVDNTITDTNVVSVTPDCVNYNLTTYACSGGTASAFATIADINALTLSPGDSVLLRQGQLWREALVLKSSGISGSPITIGAYGSGDKPMLKGSDIKANADFVLYDAPTNTYYVSHTAPDANLNAVWESGIKLTSASSVANCQATSGSSYYDNSAHKVYIHSAQADPSPLTNGLVYEAATRKMVVDGQTNSNNWIVYDNLDIRHGYSELSAMVIAGDNNIVRNSDFYDNANHHLSFYGANNLGEDIYGENCAGGAFLFYSSAATTGNIFRRLTSVGNKVWTGSAIQSHGGATGNIVEDSTLSQTINQTVGVGAVGISGAGTSIIIRRTKISGNWFYTFKTSTDGGADSEFYNNVIDGTNLRNVAISLLSGATGVKIYNNTYYNMAGGFYLLGLGTGSSATFKNNITYVKDWYVLGITGALIADNNLYYGSGRGTPFYIDGVQKTWAQWQAAGYDAHGLIADPLYVSAASGDFSLQSASPAINAGVDLGTTYQLGLASSSSWPSSVVTLNQNYFGSGWDIGAYVYNNDSTAPVTSDNIDVSWHNSNVTVTLICDDGAGSGCANTYYTTDGTVPTTSSSQGTSFTLSTAGTYTIKYFSVDNGINTESVKTSSNQVKIDTTAPTTTVSSANTGNTATSTLSCTDASSGCATTYYCIDTDNTCTPTTVYSTPVTYQILHTTYFRFYSIDSATNVSSTNADIIHLQGGGGIGMSTSWSGTTTVLPPAPNDQNVNTNANTQTQTAQTSTGSNMTQQQKSALILQIKQQLILLITQLIQMLTLQMGQMGK